MILERLQTCVIIASGSSTIRCSKCARSSSSLTVFYMNTTSYAEFIGYSAVHPTHRGGLHTMSVHRFVLVSVQQTSEGRVYRLESPHNGHGNYRIPHYSIMQASLQDLFPDDAIVGLPFHDSASSTKVYLGG